MIGLAAAQRQQDTERTNEDRKFAGFRQRREETVQSEKAVDYILKIKKQKHQ